MRHYYFEHLARWEPTREDIEHSKDRIEEMNILDLRQRFARMTKISSIWGFAEALHRKVNELENTKYPYDIFPWSSLRGVKEWQKGIIAQREGLEDLEDDIASFLSACNYSQHNVSYNGRVELADQ